VLHAADQMRILRGNNDPALESIVSGITLLVSASNGEESRKNSVSFVVIASMTLLRIEWSVPLRAFRANSA
jgi:hypothetical protein